jgi:SAM-dependent methyltransferase
MSSAPPRIFDRAAYRARRSRATRLQGDIFLAEDAAAQIAFRLAAVNRHFKLALDVRSQPRTFSILQPLAEAWVRTGFAVDVPSVIGDEESLPFADASFDLVTSVLGLHAVNDLPGVLWQIRRVLKPDGLFIGALFGGDTLKELRVSFAAAEEATLGGASPRIAPFADVRDLGGLLQRAGFALPVADVERTIVEYRELTGLFADLKALGETNVLAGRRRELLSRRTLQAIVREYQERFGDAQGRFPASFEIVYLTGWAPHESQQKPLAPGSAKTRLADALKRDPN